ncbi:MAG: TauD/TfdA family dioxygenase [Gammaproteobacteria bacterium]|nr:TauD/TfdA family dioxygenase [Gammaproteobacteria bacterium]
MKLHQLAYNETMTPSVIGEMVAKAAYENHLVHVVDIPFKEDVLADFYHQVTENIGECLDLAETEGSYSVGGKWTHVCYDPSLQNAYRSSSNAQPLHTDGSYLFESPDATCMYCISAASEGGGTIFITAEELMTYLKKDDPALFDQLMNTPVCFSRSFENGANEKTRKIIEVDEQGKITLTWNYFRVDPNQSADTKEMCEAFHHYLQTQIVGSDRVHTVFLKPGEAILWLDEQVLHGRDAFLGSEYGVRNLAKTSINLKGFKP